MATLITWGLASALGSSFLVCALLVLTQRWHGRLTLDHDLAGAQKIHVKPVPRIGGLGLAFGLLIAVVTGYFAGGKTYPTTLILLTCAMPVFAAGLVEDLTKKVRIRTRLVASFVSAALAIWLLNARLTDLDTVVLDDLIKYSAFSILFTIFAVGGVTHSINIVDGLNGLASGTVSIMLGGLAALAWMHGDVLVMKLCLWGIASMVGFLLLNYPFGRIFLGDGGAYLAGFWLAECGILLLQRNPAISTWSVLLACIYPVWETIFSIYRRSVRDRVNSGHADFGHLHQLLYRRLRSSTQLKSDTTPVWREHGLATAAIWAMVIGCQILAVLANENTSTLFTAACLYTLCYGWMYKLLTPQSAPDSHRVSAVNI